MFTAALKTFFGSAVGALTDAYFNLVTLLLPGNGTNGAQNNTFLDSSTNNFTITRNGNTTQGTFSPFSQTGWSNFFDGTGDYFTWSGSAIGASQFSFECWFYHTGSFGSIQALLGPNSATNGGISVRIASSTQIKIDRLGVGESVFTVPTMSANTWYHLVACRGASNTTTVFLNGTRSSTGTITDSYSYGDAKSISYLNSSTPFEFTGYLSNVRLVVGSSAYDPTQSSITVPTAPLTAIADTKLLTCQSNRFVDNSSNAFAITVNGSPSVQAFSPFAPTAAYSAATNGGSGYFDGSGDWLTAGAASDWTFMHNGSDWTCEFWVYHTGTAAYTIVSTTAFSAEIGFTLAINSTYASGLVNGVQLYIVRGSSGSEAIFNSTALLAVNQWNYVAVTFTSSTKTCAFTINGASAGSTANTGFAYSSSSPTNTLAIGRYQGSTPSNYLVGYLSSLRISTNVRTGLTTVPTSPYTSDANTKLLTNFTNAGITDATAKNDLETVGNAQISTTQSKWGGSSMYFDGTGDAILISNSSASPNLEFQGDFTVECWFYLAGGAGTRREIIHYDDGSNGLGIFIQTTNVLWAGVVNYSASSFTPSLNTWYHVALVRSGTATNNCKLYVDGTQYLQFTNTTAINPNATMSIGRTSTGANDLNGYIDDLRITKGYARYTANFTAPTAAFPVQ